MSLELVPQSAPSHCANIAEPPLGTLPKATALEVGRLLLSHPVAPGEAALLGPVAQQGSLADPAATVEQEQLAAPAALEPLAQRKLCAAVDKHGAP